MSGDVDSTFGYSIVVENVGVAVEILSIARCVPNSCLFPVSGSAILEMLQIKNC